jgi:broad specificity phosphatase PhoE
MRLVLIRHAESKHVRLKVITGRTICPGLTENGFIQAQRLAERFRESGELRDCAALFSSPLPRARQTAEAILPVFAGMMIEECADLCELDPGEAEGLTREAYRQRYGEFDLAAFPGRPYAPGGESWDGFLERVRAIHERLAERYAGKTVVAVTHAGFIVAAMLVMLAMPVSGARAWLEPSHTGITEWQVEKQRWVLVRYNDTAHTQEFDCSG